MDIMSGVQYGFAGGVVGGGGGLAWDVYNGGNSFGAMFAGGGGGGAGGFAIGSGIVSGILSGPLSIMIIGFMLAMLVVCSVILIRYDKEKEE